MGEKRKEGTFNQIKEVINILSPSVDNYLYVMDIKNDIYFISANAMERFSIQKQEFHFLCIYSIIFSGPLLLPYIYSFTFSFSLFIDSSIFLFASS